MKRVRTHHRGASISEYALIFGLVVLVAIPAVIFLGSTINEGTATNADNYGQGAQQVAAVLDAPTSDPYSGFNAMASNASDFPLANEGMNGIGEMLSEGSVTSSSDGTELLAEYIAQMASSGVGPSGQVLEAEEQAFFSQLADMARLLADAEEAAEECSDSCVKQSTVRQTIKNGESGGKSYRNITVSETDWKKINDALRDVSNANSDFLDEYDAVIGGLKAKNPQLAAEIEILAGVITNSAQHFVKNNGDGTVTINNRETVGDYDASDLATYEVPEITEAAADEIDRAEEEASGRERPDHPHHEECSNSGQGSRC